MNVERIAEVVEGFAAEQTLDTVLAANENARVCLTNSFQAEDMAVLHILRQRIPEVPVLFLDTGYHFAQTYEYRDRMAKEWSLRLVNVLPKQTVPEQESAFGILYHSDPTRCCQLRKVEPLMRALEPFDVWFKEQLATLFPPEVDLSQPVPGVQQIWDWQRATAAV